MKVAKRKESLCWAFISSLVMAFAVFFPFASPAFEITPDFACSRAEQEFMAITGSSDAKVLDSGRYCTKGSCWHSVKVSNGDQSASEIYFISMDGTLTLSGWEELNALRLQTAGWESKIDPALASKLSRKGPRDSVQIIVVLKDQPDIEEIAKQAEKEAFGAPNEDSGSFKKSIGAARTAVNDKAAAFNEAHGQGEVANAIESLGGRVYLRGTVRNHLAAEVPAQAVESIAADPRVERIEADLEARGHLDVSIPTIGVDSVWSGYTTGWDNSKFRIDVGIMDSGVGDADGHPNLPVYRHQNFDTVELYNYDNHGHGTHVAGITSSNHATYRGVSYASKLWNLKVAHAVPGGASSSFSAAMNALQYAYDNNIEVVNYSYGYYPPADDPPQPYSLVDGSSELSRTLDAYAEVGLIATISSGNSGSSYDTIGIPGDAFNVLTVGNMQDQGTTSRADDTLRASSSRGYTYDGRTKPDVAAPGTTIYSCNYATDAFVNMSGTSMAAPHVAGVVALLTDYWAEIYRQRIGGASSANILLRGGPLAVRAMVMSMADETTGESSVSQNDRQTGAGYINAYDSIQQLNRTKVIIGDVAHHQYLWYSVAIPAGQTLKAALVWNRMVNVSTKTATEPIADLDLELYNSAGLLLHSSDAQTNWEKIAYTNNTGSTMICMIRLFGFSISSDLNRVQNFALSCNFPLTPVGTVRGDFGDFDEDGDGDFIIFRPSSGKWYAMDQNEITLSGLGWGRAGDIPVPGEWHSANWYVDCDLGIWRPSDGRWYAKDTASGAAIFNEGYGMSGDVPVPGNYDGSGGTDLGVWRSSNSTWYIKYKPSNTTVTKKWGLWNDIPVPAEYGGSYWNTDLGIWRPSNGYWYVWELFSNTQIVLKGWGTFGDVPVPADFTGDGFAELAVFRPSNSTWYISNPSGSYVRTIPYGAAGDVPMPMDYNGDGRAELCVFRPSEGRWHCREVDGAGKYSMPYGMYTDLPSGSHHR